MGSKTGTSRLNPFDTLPLLIETIKASQTIVIPADLRILEAMVTGPTSVRSHRNGDGCWRRIASDAMCWQLIVDIDDGLNTNS